MLYPVAIQQRDGIYHAHLPDIPDLNIQNVSMADTIATARQSVMNHLIQLIDEEIELPEASEINTHLTNQKYAGWTWAIINIDINRIAGEKVNVNVNLPKRFYERLQQYLDTNQLDLNVFVIDSIKKAID